MRHIRNKDLNLLRVFGVLWKERNVTRAARALNMTQPALSRALGRLRAEFGDPLFVRVPRGVTPTDRAREAAEPVLALLENLETVYSPQPGFDPKAVRQVVTLATSDYFEVVAAAKLIPDLMREAPGLTLNFRSVPGAIPREHMERGEIDLVVYGIYEPLPEGYHQQALYTDRYVSAIRKGHSAKKVTLESFANLPHVLVTPRGDVRGIVDEALGKSKKTRRIAVGSPHFLSAGWMAAHTDLVLTAPGLIVDHLKRFLPLQDFPTPVALPALKLFQVWHARTHHDPVFQWLRRRIAHCFGPLSGKKAN